MKGPICGAMLTVFACLAGAQPLYAQASAASVGLTTARGASALALDASEASGGGFMDFIHKLSGPQFYGGGLTFSYGLRRGAPRDRNGDWVEARLRLRLSAAWRTSVDDSAAVGSPDADLTMFSFQVTPEFDVVGPLGVAGGIAAHRYGGDADSFWHFSFPVFAQLRFRKNRPVVPFLGGGYHVFLPFDANDFAPVVVKIDREGTEWVPFAFAGIEFRF